MSSLFRCPICAVPLMRGERAYTCPTGHSYDLSAEGYTHLLPANQKNSKNPGDDKQMVAARCAFLDKGYYAPLRSALTDLAIELTQDIDSPALLDSGCGEGTTPPVWPPPCPTPTSRASTSPSSPCAVRRKRPRASSSPWPPPTACRSWTTVFTCCIISSPPCRRRNLPVC